MVKKVLCIGGATQDIFLNYQGADTMTISKKNMVQSYMLFESGEKLEIDNLLYLTGGGATNSAVSFSRLGLHASCFATVGNDAAGVMIIEALKQENIDVSTIYRTNNQQTGVSCIVNTLRNDRTIFAFRGANAYLDQEKIPYDTISSSDQLYITSLSGKSAALLPQLVSCAKEQQVPVAINPGTSQLSQNTASLKQSLKDIDTLIMNSSEARIFMVALTTVDEMYKTSLKSTSTLNPCALNQADHRPYLMEFPLLCENSTFSMCKFFEAVLDMGPKIVVVTNGANGVYVATKECIYFHPSIKSKLINTVGAGDAFGSCFVASLVSGFKIQDALRNGIINSASVLEHIGAKEGLLNFDQIKEKLNNISPKLLETFAF